MPKTRFKSVTISEHHYNKLIEIAKSRKISMAEWVEDHIDNEC